MLKDRARYGTSAATAAKAAVEGALEAAGSLGTTAVTAVRDVLVTAVSGLKDVVCAVLPKGGETPSAGTGTEAAPEKKTPKAH